MAARPELYLNGTLYCDWRVQIYDCFGDHWFPQLYLACGILASVAAISNCFQVYQYLILTKIPLIRDGQISSSPATSISILLFHLLSAIHSFLLYTDAYTSFVQREIMNSLPLVLLLGISSLLFQGIMIVVASVNHFDLNPKQIQRLFMGYLIQATIALLVTAGISGHFRDIGDGSAQSIAFKAMFSTIACECMLFGVVTIYAGQNFLKISEEVKGNSVTKSNEVKKIRFMTIIVMLSFSLDSTLMLVMGFYPGSFLIPGLSIFFMVFLLIPMHVISFVLLIRTFFPKQQQQQPEETSMETTTTAN